MKTHLAAAAFAVRLLGSCSAQGDNLATIGNERIRIEFNQREGTYCLYDQRDGNPVVKDAIFSLNGHRSTDGFTFVVQTIAVHDELGEGRALCIAGTMEGAPELSLRITLHEGHSAVVFQQGVKNTSQEDMRIMEFSPLAGKAFPGRDASGYLTLDGDNGQKMTRVSRGNKLETLNNALISFGLEGARKTSLVIGGLAYHEFQRFVTATRHEGTAASENWIDLAITASDPVGKLVDGGAAYQLADTCYLNFMADNRFELLEQYGRDLGVANRVDLHGIDYPILNFWYCYMDKYGNGKFRNNSLGTIEEMEEVRKTGFLKYGPFALRLEPDDYAHPSNQQGWWDDAHWQMYTGGQLLEPYETIGKWGKRIQELGGTPYIYCQTGRRSQDYCEAFPGHCLFNDPWAKRSNGGGFGKNKEGYWSYDYTDPGFIAHMHDVYANLGSGGVKGIKFDYPFTGWAYDGGFEDKYATTVSAYRNIFRLAYEGLGDGSDIQERIPPYGDVALGVVTTQRTEGDNDRVYPGRISKTGLRWYKNRVVACYDHDPVNPFHTYPENSIDGWRAALTMASTTSGRLEIGKYFEAMSAEHLHALSRMVPLVRSPKSARPVDAFSGKTYPEIYDYIISPEWHILTFYNHRIEGQEWPQGSWQYGRGAENGPQFVPNKMLPNTIGLNMGKALDDGGLGFQVEDEYHVFDFWNWCYRGKVSGNVDFEQALREGEARVMAVHKAVSHPQFLSTDRHFMQGYLDFAKVPEWNADQSELVGSSKAIAGEPYRIIVAGNGNAMESVDAAQAEVSFRMFDAVAGLYEITLLSRDNAEVAWHARFK